MTDRITLTDEEIERLDPWEARSYCSCGEEFCLHQEETLRPVVESIVAARVAEALRDAAARFRLGKNESLHWYTVAERLDNQANEYDPQEGA